MHWHEQKGRSKGILHTHRTVVTMLQHMLATYEWPAQIRYLVATPISHAAGSLILPTLLHGGTVYLSDKFSSADFLRRVQEHRINLTFLVPTQIYGLLDHAGLSAADLSSLELVLYGAAPIWPGATTTCRGRTCCVHAARSSPATRSRSIAESGVPGFEVVGWMAAFVPKGTPAPIGAPC